MQGKVCFWFSKTLPGILSSKFLVPDKQKKKKKKSKQHSNALFFFSFFYLH